MTKFVVTEGWVYKKLKTPEVKTLPYARLCVPTHRDFKPGWLLIAPKPVAGQDEKLLVETDDPYEVVKVLSQKSSRAKELEVFLALETLEVSSVERSEPGRKASGKAAAKPKAKRAKA